MTVETLSIESRHGVADVEAALSRLEAAPPVTDFLLNTLLRHRQFGGLGAMLQLIATWARRCPTAAIRIYVTDPSQDASHLANFVKSDHGLVATLLGYDLRDRDGIRSLRADALLGATARLKQMNTVTQARRGDKVFMLVADHVPNVAPATLYAHGPADRQTNPRSWSGFHDLARQILTKLRHGEHSRIPADTVVGQVATILRELFQNTHDWARHDAIGSRLTRSVRGVRAELYSHDSSLHAEMVQNEPMLHGFVSHPALQRDGTRQRIIELTVFDSGPGLTARRVKQLQAMGEPTGTPPIDMEHRAAMDCLRTHFTTGVASHRGDGLHLVLRTLSELGGFLRVRTGRLALGRDFLAHPYDLSTNQREPYLLDWVTGGATPTPMGLAEGTLITLMFPVQYAD